MTIKTTLAAMVSIGDRNHLTKYSFKRFYMWASRNGYTCILIKHPLTSKNVLPHYNKLLVPHSFPGFDRYVICDDDLLLSNLAPALPEVPHGFVGLAKDAVQNLTEANFVKWTGNTGFIISDSTSSDLLYKAYENGDVQDVWGIADQGALNHILWKENKIFEIDQRWNYAPILDFFIRDSD